VLGLVFNRAKSGRKDHYYYNYKEYYAFSQTCAGKRRFAGSEQP